ncbi:MAG: RagB/SusD family nutrient uptake outer membrane protein [Butyricimonas faecihominis]
MQKPNGSSQLGQSIRSAEAFLNQWRLMLFSGEEGLALSELNDFRKTRIVGYSDVNLSGQALLDEIRLERRKELCFEGHRWF